jgi:hypothetical protein
MAIYENIGRNYGYEDAKKRAKEFYKTIGVIWCPALNDYIVFNKRGFQHLMRKKGLLRPKTEQIRRFLILPYVKDILEDSKTLPSHSVREDKESRIDLWIFAANIQNLHVKVIIRQTQTGRKHFLSIYGKTQKSTQ